jgi:hypothetical protein
MAWELIASGDRSNLNTLPSYEADLAEGQDARLDFKFVTYVPSFQVDSLRNSLSMAGVTNLRVVSAGNTIQIFYTKDPWWVPVIIIAVLALAILIISWLFFRNVESTTGPIGGILLLAGGALIAGILAYSIFSNRRVT